MPFLVLANSHAFASSIPSLTKLLCLVLILRHCLQIHIRSLRLIHSSCTGCHIEVHLHGVSARSPRVRTIAFIPCTRRIYCIGFVQCWTSSCVADLSALIQPHIRFLFIGSGLCLRLPSDSTSQWTPLPLANGSHCQAHSGLSPPSYRPCRAHHKRKRPAVSSRALPFSIAGRRSGS